MARSLYQMRLIGPLLRSYQERLTPRGRYLFWVMLVLGALRPDARQSQVFLLFAAAAGIFLAAALFVLRGVPRVRIACRMPTRATALMPLRIPVILHDTAGRVQPGLQLSFPRAKKWGSSLTFSPPETYFECGPGSPAEAQVEFRALRRGRYLVPGPAVRTTDPLRLLATRPVVLPDEVLLVYPRFFFMEDFPVSLARRYQPGGIPLSSSTGDAIEFIGTREYRQGDAVKNIHWRSWARRGEPVVKEFQEEYFCRIALILDTFLPRPAGEAHLQAFEASISVLASLADFFGRGEYVVDILAAGPDLYEVSAGRSLAYLDNILDVLACLEPCYDPPFQTIGPPLFDKLAQITTVVAVLQDWDAERRDFLRRVKSLGTAVTVIMVHEGDTREPWQNAAAELDSVNLMTPMDVERLLGAPQ